MKKIRSILLLVVVAFILTGCMRFNAQMNIKKDKSMDFSIVYALDTSVWGEEGQMKDSDIKEMEKGGYKVEKYTDGNYKGVKLTKKVKNIDEVSTEKDAEFDLSGITNSKDNSKKKYLFKVKKGFLKNRYTAKYKFDSSESGMTDTDTDTSTDTSDDDWNFDDDTSYDTEDSTGTDDIDYTEMMSSMDLSFQVNLPYDAIDHNSNNTTNNKKELKWDLTKMNNEDIEFTFELYNMTNIIILIAAGCVLVVVIIIVIILIINGKKKKQAVNPTTVAAEPAPQQPTDVQ